MAEGWISLHRKFLTWEWFEDTNMVKLFIYLLLKANHKPDKWRGIDIGRGQLLTGLDSLNKDTKISKQTIRTCLKRLENTKEINTQVTNKYRIITICNYDSYQDKEKHTNKQVTNNQQSTNNQLTANNNVNNINKENNINTFFDKFKELTGKKVRVIDDKTKRQFNARIKEGYTMDDIMAAVKNCHGDKYHIENPQFLTMEFITRSDKLQKYVNADKSHSLKEDENLPSHLQGMVF